MLCEEVDTVSEPGIQSGMLLFQSRVQQQTLHWFMGEFVPHTIFNKLKNSIFFPDFFLSFPKNVQGKNNISVFQCNNVKSIFWFYILIFNDKLCNLHLFDGEGYSKFTVHRRHNIER